MTHIAIAVSVSMGELLTADTNDLGRADLCHSFALNLRFSTGSIEIVQKPDTAGLPARSRLTPKR